MILKLSVLNYSCILHSIHINADLTKIRVLVQTYQNFKIILIDLKVILKHSNSIVNY